MAGSKILVLGGTGPAGICLLRELLHRGHATIAYARNPAKIPDDVSSNSLLQVIQGELTDRTSLSTAISQCTAVISLLGPNGFGAMDNRLYADIYAKNVFPLMREHSVRRILAMGTVTISSPDDGFSLLRWLGINLVYFMARSAYHNIINIGKVFDTEAEGLDWTVFRIMAIPGGSDAESWRNDREDGEAFVGSVSGEGWSFSQKRSALARWLVDAVEGKADEWIGKMPAVSRLSGSKRQVD